jgi:hypothetical protein
MFSFEGGQPINAVELPQDAHPVGWLGWTLNDQAIIYGKFLDGVQNYWLQPIGGGRPKQLTFFNRDQRAMPRGYGREAWSPDGRDLLFAGGERRSDVVMMTGLK